MRCETLAGFQSHNRLVLIRSSGGIGQEVFTSSSSFTPSRGKPLRVHYRSKQSSAQEGTFQNQNEYNYFHI